MVNLRAAIKTMEAATLLARTTFHRLQYVGPYVGMPTSRFK
ncbi:hypothetical protein PMI09_04143 [Rhizobium sp. CF122]|nr:hypothetical protein PMI09_04143 [Rhizobium sp. CF122]